MAKKKSQDPLDAPADEGVTSTIEEAMDELGQIVGRLETGQETLEESLRQFERGMVLLRLCHRQLDSAAQRIEIVTRMADGEEISTAEFDSTSTLQRKQRGHASASETLDEESTGTSDSLF